MNLDLKVFWNKIAALFHRKQGVQNHSIAQPVRDWKVILLCIALGLVCASVFAGYVYYSVTTPISGQENAQPVSSKSKLKATEIKNILDAFNARAQRHKTYLQGEGGLSDPSR